MPNPHLARVALRAWKDQLDDTGALPWQRALYTHVVETVGLSTKRLAGGAEQEGALKTMTFEGMKDVVCTRQGGSIIMLAASWCGSCTTAKQYLKENGKSSPIVHALDVDKLTSDQRLNDWKTGFVHKFDGDEKTQKNSLITYYPTFLFVYRDTTPRLKKVDLEGGASVEQVQEEFSKWKQQQEAK